MGNGWNGQYSSWRSSAVNEMGNWARRKEEMSSQYGRWVYSHSQRPCFLPILFTHEQCNHNFTLSGSPSYTGRTSIHSPTLQSRITIHQHLSPAHSPQQQISFNTVTEWVTYDTCTNIHTWSTNFWSINFLARLGWKSGDSKNRRKNS